MKKHDKDTIKKYNNQIFYKLFLKRGKKFYKNFYKV